MNFPLYFCLNGFIYFKWLSPTNYVKSIVEYVGTIWQISENDNKIYKFGQWLEDNVTAVQITEDEYQEHISDLVEKAKNHLASHSGT